MTTKKELEARLECIEGLMSTMARAGRVQAAAGIRLTGSVSGLVDRIVALEKNCHEPQEIEPRVIRALLKFGIVSKIETADGKADWVVIPRVIMDDALKTLLDAQFGVPDDAASKPADDLACADVYAGAALDALAAKYGLGRDPEMTDVQFRPVVVAAIAGGVDPKLKVRVAGGTPGVGYFDGIDPRHDSGELPHPQPLKRDTVPAFKPGDQVTLTVEVKNEDMGFTIPKGSPGEIVDQAENKPGLWRVLFPCMGAFFIDEKTLKHRASASNVKPDDDLLEIPAFLRKYFADPSPPPRLGVGGLARMVLRSMFRDEDPIDIRHLCGHGVDNGTAEEYPDEIDLPTDEDAVSILAECGFGFIGHSRQAGDLVRKIVERWGDRA